MSAAPPLPRAARIVIAPGVPPPPLAGVLAAGFARGGRPFEVVFELGSDEEVDWFVHLESGAPVPVGLVHRGSGATAPVGLVHRGSGVPAPVGPGTLFGPGAPTSAPGWRCRPADPEPGDRPEDLGALPITTWQGFGWRGPAFRILAGRGDRCRPVAHALREVVYAVETWSAGSFHFDDADLGAFPGWLDGWREGLRHLPWRLAWTGMADGRAVGGESRGET